MDQIEKRKIDHIKICLKDSSKYTKTALFEDIVILNSGICGINYDKISTKTTFLKKEIDAPILVEAITGGCKLCAKINETLAKLCEECQIPMEVGSQKAGIKIKELRYSFEIVKEFDIPIRISNIGAVDLMIRKDWNEDTILECIEMIDAHAVAIHFNPMQELFQPEGDKNFKNLNKIKEIIQNFKEKYGNIPFIAKQVGEGFSHKDAEILKKIGFDWIDIGGAGGTNFSKVELMRGSKINEKISEEFGIPTALSILLVKKHFDNIIASGGLSDGIDLFKSLVLGAKIGGFARKFLKPAYEIVTKDKEFSILTKTYEDIKNDLICCMYCTGIENICDISKVKYALTGKLRELYCSFLKI